MNTDRLKYRVWDTVEKRYLQPDESHINGNGDLYICKSLDGGWEWRIAEKERYIIEQCTGLKDKNGRLIYEGDIFSGGFGLIIVVFDEEHAEWIANYQGFDSEGLWYCDFEQCEIIGNIHENPELMEGYEQ